MNSQQSTFLGCADADAVRALPAGHVVALGSGRLSILSGRVWVTHQGDPGDHVLGAGESVTLAAAGHTLVEPWERDTPAVIAWQPSSLLERARDRFDRIFGRCFELMNPAGRVGLGSVGGIAALALAGYLFITLAESRVESSVRELAGAQAATTVLHNSARGAAGASANRGRLSDGVDNGERAQGAAQQAGRRAPGAA